VRVLAVNAGSSSLKLSVVSADDRLEAHEELDAPGGRLDAGELRAAIARLGEVEAVGHRIVHGGTRYRRPVVVDEAVRAGLEELADLAPLHQRQGLEALDLVGSELPGLAAVACFDTAFHATMPQAAATYALPAEWRQGLGLRRFGFHGLSHAWASRRAAELAGAPMAELRTVSCHLGAGASLAAVSGGASVDTTMGFTPLEGLVMATRSGSVDPGLLLWLAERKGMAPSELSSALEHRSGLAGLAGTPDMRQVLQAEAGGDPGAALAVATYLHRLRGGIAAMAAAMGGMDALVFTGGVGERSASVRWRAAEGLGFLGVSLDRRANQAASGDRRVSAQGSAVVAFVVEAREDLEIARGTRWALGRP
jgi:acetate kinase